MIREEKGQKSVVVRHGLTGAEAGDACRSASKESLIMNKCGSKRKSHKPHGLPHLRILRQRKGLSLGQLAERTGIRRDTITHLEDGRVDPQPYHVRLLARVLEVQQFDMI